MHLGLRGVCQPATSQQMRPRRMVAYLLCLNLFLLLLEASELPGWAAHISSVHIIPTVQLVADVPRAAAEQVTVKVGDHLIQQVVRGNPISEWWDPENFPETVQSVVVSAATPLGKSKLCILMADSRQSPWDDSQKRHMQLGKAPGDMFVLPAMINMVYAVQQGYDFVHFKVHRKQAARHPAWSKLLALRAVLPKYDFVMYLDSDAFVRPPGTAHLLEAIIADAGLDSGKFLAATKEAQGYQDIANTGIMALRSCPEAVRMLDDWWLSIVRFRELSGYRLAWPFEQGAFTQVVYPQYNISISLLALLVYNSPKGKHIQHIWSLLKDAERENAFLDAAGAVMQEIEGSHTRQNHHHDAQPLELAQRLLRTVDEVLASKRTT